MLSRINTTVGVYRNMDIEVNEVEDKDLENHINFNKMMRPGRMLIVNGVCLYQGLFPTEEVEAAVSRVKEILETAALSTQG